MWSWRVKMLTQNLFMLLLLLMLILRIVLAKVCCRFGSWGLVIMLNFFFFRFCAQGLVKILKLKFRQDLYGEKIFYVGKKLVKLSTLATLVTHWLTHSVTNFPTICDEILLFGWDFELSARSRLWRRNLIMICVVFDLVIWLIRLLW